MRASACALCFALYSFDIKEPLHTYVSYNYRKPHIVANRLDFLVFSLYLSIFNFDVVIAVYFFCFCSIFISKYRNNFRKNNINGNRLEWSEKQSRVKQVVRPQIGSIVVLINCIYICIEVNNFKNVDYIGTGVNQLSDSAWSETVREGIQYNHLSHNIVA